MLPTGGESCTVPHSDESVNVYATQTGVSVLNKLLSMTMCLYLRFDGLMKKGDRARELQTDIEGVRESLAGFREEYMGSRKIGRPLKKSSDRVRNDVF